MIEPSDLLVLGGLTIDRFPDGSQAAGGSVLHAARAVASAGLHGAAITVAGPEPEAVAAVAELRALGPALVREAPQCIRFAIDERGHDRRLLFEGRGDRLRITESEISAFEARAVLIAPVAGELGPGAIPATRGVSYRAAALQGWLRTLRVGRPVRYLSPERIEAKLVHELAQFDLLTASLDDLGGMADPGAALDLLRSAFGRRPLLALTDGAAGARLDLPDGSRHHIVPPHVVSRVSMVGAGDAFAAILAAELGSGQDPLEAARSAAASTASLLASRHL